VNKVKFEDKIAVIDHELQKRRGKWRLDSISYIDFDDVCQIIRKHVNEKWNQWDQTRPFEKWLNKVITHQIINLIRNNYGNVAPPCNGCAFNLWGNHCEYTPSSLKCAECPLYRDWEKSKKNGYNIKMASSIHAEEYIERKSSSLSFDQGINVEDFIPGFHKIMEQKLKPKLFSVYKLLYIDNVSEDKIKKRFDKNPDNASKKLNAAKRKIVKIAKEVLVDIDIFKCNE
jgi:RNA polymerase sigma factor (sigma-70 family)